MTASGPNLNGEVPTILVKDNEGRVLHCCLEQLIPLDENEYALLTPVDTPVCLVRFNKDSDPEPIDSVANSEPILSVADVVLQEHDLTLVRSAVTLTVTGELDDPDPEDLEELEELEDEESEDLEDYVELINFLVDEQQYGLYIPCEPFLFLGRIDDGQATLVEGEEFERIQPRIEAELEERELTD